MVYKGIKYIIIKIDKREEKTTVKVETLWSSYEFLTAGEKKREIISKSAKDIVLKALQRLNNDPILIEKITHTPPIDTSPVVENLKDGKRYIFTFVNGSVPFEKLLKGRKTA